MLFFKKKNVCEPSFEIISESSSFQLREAYNALCTNLFHISIEDKCKKIAVCSASYGEGKDSVAINLAISLAENLRDSKVLLLDFDMRTSCVSEFIKGKLEVSDCVDIEVDDITVNKTDISNLDISVCKTPIINPASLICSEETALFFAKCEERYDYVIINTAPVTEFSDTLLLTSRVNGCLLVARKKHSTVKMLDKAEAALKSSGAEIFGIVLTGNKIK